jgi:diguanylate cyclase (GGDEF)-like protein
MKNIAVLIHSLTVEYSTDILNGIVGYFSNNPEYRLIIAQTKNPNCKFGLYEYQYWTVSDLLLSNDIDGIIVISGSYSSTMLYEELGNYLKKFSTRKPVISIGVNLNLNKNYYTHVDCDTVYERVVNHLKNTHGCKNFAYITPNLEKSLEGKERFEAFKKALKKHGLELNPDNIFTANFDIESSYTIFKELFKKPEDITFDALLGSNDLTASGAMTALKEIGVKIPEDVKIIGFDNTSHTLSTNPKLSTIDQNIYQQGFAGGQLMDQVLSGENPDSVSNINIFPVYRESCACKSDPSENIFTNRYKFNISSEVYLSKINTVYTLMDMLKANNTLESFFTSLKDLTEAAGFTNFGICLYEKPVLISKDDKFILPKKALLSMYIDENTEIFESGETFSPQKNLLPKQYIENLKNINFVHPIYSGEKNYGYIICSLKQAAFPMHCLNLRLISNAISQAYEYNNSINENKELSIQNKQLKKDKKSLSLQSKTDELTRILNRRGFMELAEKTLDLALEMNSKGLVFFIDMDGLKKINDTYGHKMGDSAIKALATVLAKTLRANDVIGRLSGDEFAAITVGMEKKQIKKIHAKIDEYCDEISREKNFPFKLSCSLGAVEFNSKNKSITKLLMEADKQLYIEKNEKYKINRI